jgi:hypothetical protein
MLGLPLLPDGRRAYRWGDHGSTRSGVMTSENRLHGKELNGSEQTESPDHVEYAKKRNPDTELHLDDEKDSLYDDGLDVEDDTEKLADTHAERRTGG